MSLYDAMVGVGGVVLLAVALVIMDMGVGRSADDLNFVGRGRMSSRSSLETHVDSRGRHLR